MKMIVTFLLIKTFFYAVQIPFVVPVFKGFSFVIQFFPPCQCDQHFGKAFFVDKSESHRRGIVEFKSLLPVEVVFVVIFASFSSYNTYNML